MTRERKARPHSETAFAPMSTRGMPYVDVAYIRDAAKTVRRDYGEYRGWEYYRRSGWRIVKVKIEVIG